MRFNVLKIKALKMCWKYVLLSINDNLTYRETLCFTKKMSKYAIFDIKKYRIFASG